MNFKSLLGRLLLKILPILIDWLAAYFREQAERRENQRRADDLNSSETEDEFDRATDRLP